MFHFSRIKRGIFPGQKGVLCFSFIVFFSLHSGKTNTTFRFSKLDKVGGTCVFSFFNGKKLGEHPEGPCQNSSRNIFRILQLSVIELNWQRPDKRLFHVGECLSAVPDQSLYEKLRGWDDATNEPPSLEPHFWGGDDFSPHSASW